MKLEFIYNNKIENPWSNVNKILKQLKSLEKSSIKCRIIDTVGLPDERLRDIYSKACMPSVYKRYRIRQIFGSRNNSGTFFGKNQPALLVYEENREYPIDTYPYEEEREIISIEKFLENLIGGEK